MAEKEIVLTARTTFVIEMEHPNNWDIKSPGEQVFVAGDRENRNALERIIREATGTAGRNIRIISSETSIVTAKVKK